MVSIAAGCVVSRSSIRRWGCIDAVICCVRIVRVINVRCVSRGRDGVRLIIVQVPMQPIIRHRLKHIHMHLCVDFVIQFIIYLL